MTKYTIKPTGQFKKDADLILVIHEGEIIERGTHEELLAMKGFYYKMQMAQE